MKVNDTAAEIKRLKEQHNAIILAHNYQIDEVQEIADYVGDSFALSKLAASTHADVIVFCGVHFMAESASILSPDKIVLLPDKNAGCPLADTITPEALREKKKDYPEAAVVCYVNSSAEVKAESDICCTSSNAVRIVNSLEENQILFVPDKNLANYVARQTHKEIIPWDGCCITHHRVKVEDIEKVRQYHPDGVIVVHPECRPEVVALADHVGSTSEILRFSRESRAQKIIVGTEMGMLYRLKKESPHKEFYLLSQGLICPNMKMTTLTKIKDALETLEPQIKVKEAVRLAAYGTLERMLQVTAG
ncbi:quinolinate synthase NadA [Desulfitibacter alkalitolerans]|uniref:quinolinate synthase NadA n=1 Tax=Desulfitibacter alkalitolerans TaxID=264641 RepID=UPI000484C698|nr:quinolinate synthase NadA [Desulfitibacter alkalitolerans]